MNEETQILLCTALFGATVYSAAGQAIAEMLDNAIEEDWKCVAGRRGRGGEGEALTPLLAIPPPLTPP